VHRYHAGPAPTNSRQSRPKSKYRSPGLRLVDRLSLKVEPGTQSMNLHIDPTPSPDAARIKHIQSRQIFGYVGRRWPADFLLHVKSPEIRQTLSSNDRGVRIRLRIA
jgi:hypothetical protein